MDKITYENLPERYDDMEQERKDKLLRWIAQNLIPMKMFNQHYSSYSLKHMIEPDEYYTNGEFKGGMLKLGYKVQDETELNWIFNVSDRSPAIIEYRRHTL